MLQMSSGDLPILIYKMIVDGCSDNQFQLLGNFLQGKCYYSRGNITFYRLLVSVFVDLKMKSDIMVGCLTCVKSTHCKTLNHSSRCTCCKLQYHKLQQPNNHEYYHTALISSSSLYGQVNFYRKNHVTDAE